MSEEKELSPAAALVQRLVWRLGIEQAHRQIDRMIDSMTVVEAAALAYDWRGTWARPKQVAPLGDWRSWGFLTGRMFGKTISASKHVNDEVEAGRASLVCLLAQDEQSSIDIQVLGPSGLIATAPPWFKPQWEASALQLAWPDGSRAFVRTPERPGKIRGLEYHLSWISELQSWPVATRLEAHSNVALSTRLGYARTVWDATPKKRHPLLLQRLRNHELEPSRHVIVRGGSREARLYVGPGVIEDLEREIGGTAKGREELEGEMLPDSDGALVKDDWINDNRRKRPDRLTRRVLAVDPAVTNRAGNDSTGIADVGLGVDGQALVLGDYSGKYEPGEWATIVLNQYLKGCDLLIAETNKGGHLVTQNIRAAAAERGLRVVVIGEEEKVPPRCAGVVFVREVHARGPKEDRAQPVATAYERGRISHVIGVELGALEDILTTWEPTVGQRSPDALDALVHAMVEILGLTVNKADKRAGYKGISEVAALLKAATKLPPKSIASLLSHPNMGGRI